MNRNQNQLSFISKLLFSTAMLLFALAGLARANSSTSQSKVPTEYFANYQIQKNRDRLLELFIEIDADAKIGKIWWSTTYGELHTIMQRIFPHFPQEYNFQVIYKQCQKTTKDMQANPTRENFDSFVENCKSPLANITNTIKSKYTVKAAATLNPSSGPAPLTVTFDARASKDPSNETIPSRNYFWYYRDIDGQDKPIGYGAVVNYKFKESWTYLVHLTVRSSNTGIFDGEATVSVNVSPKSANVIVYANGKQMSKNKYIKIGVQEAKRGVVFDGSATLPMGGREIMSHRWEITSRDGFKWTKDGDGKPGYINLPLPSQWEFLINLSVTDNEKNLVSERFSLSVSDPVAIIQQTPEKWTTSTTYGFSAAASYSLTSRLKLYTWELFDSEGVKLDTLQGKEIKKQFKKPGNYTVKLTVEDEIGNKNIDTVNVYVESTPPLPQFTITPTRTWLYPSEFHLNADSSSDMDVVNGFDSLKYDRKFSNQNAVQITNTDPENKKITVLFNEIGTHQITLTVSDKYGKISEITKDVQVQSILRPQLTLRPKAAVFGTYVTVSVKTNAPVLNYVWDFGDGMQPLPNNTNIMKHEYHSAGAYKVSLKVDGENWDTNTVYDTVFIGVKDRPIISYEIKNDFGIKLGQNDQCEDEKGVIHNAYRVDRQARFIVDTSSSVNIRGTNNQLLHHFEVDNEQLTMNNFSYKFNSLGCQYIDYTLEDTSVAQFSKERIWFKVVNALPKLTNVSIMFPQYGNEIGIWFQQANKSQDIFNSGVDPIIVKVNAEGAIDSDGAISYFKRYYYPKNNPNKILETRISPGNLPYTYFSVPKQPGEFMFGVKLFDNDDGYQTSEDLLGNGPTVLFPDAWGQPDIPIVTLKTDKVNVEVGEEVTFDVISKILSDRSDFVKERVIQIDFEGDGTIDLTTKNDRIKHVYSKPSNIKDPYKPVAYVTYRDYKGRGEAGSIVVKNGIKPALIYGVIGSTVIFKDVSVGNLLERELCRDTTQCEKGNENYREREIAEKDPTLALGYQPLKKTTFKVNYPKNWVYTVEIKAKDVNANEAKNTLQVKVGENADTKQIFSGLQMLSLPILDQSPKGQLEILLSRQLNNEVLLYLKTASPQDKCRIDSDITKDANYDGIPDNDWEFACNRIVNIPYLPIAETVIGRIFYQPYGSSKASKKDFAVRFAEFEQAFPNDTFKTQYHQLNTLIASIDDSVSVANADLRNLLIILKNDLVDINKTRSSVIQIEDFLAKKQAKLTDAQLDKLNEILVALSDHATLSAKWGNTYEVAKTEILVLLPLELKETVIKNFQHFDEPEKLAGKELSGVILDVKTVREMALSNIYKDLSQNAVDPANIGPNQIGSDDFKSTVLPNLCKIAESYLLNAPYCSEKWEFFQPPVNQKQTETGNSRPTWIKVLLWIVALAVLGFVGVIAAFAIKAKLRENYDEEE